MQACAAVETGGASQKKGKEKSIAGDLVHNYQDAHKEESLGESSIGREEGEYEPPRKKSIESVVKKITKKAFYRDLSRQDLELALEDTAKAKQKAAGMYAQLTAAEGALQNKLAAKKQRRGFEASSGLQEVPKASLPKPPAAKQ